jgi:hypothetical protein
LATKIINALSATDALKTVVKDAKTINRKLQGSRSSSPTTASNETTPVENVPNSISTSQQSYDRLIDNFSQLIDLVNAEPNYTPNESNLQAATLNATLTDLQVANSAVVSKYTEYSNARIDRNETLYNVINGLVETSLDVKKYVKSVFGANSPQYKQVSGLKFTKPKL